MSESVLLTNVPICYPHLFEKHAPPRTDRATYSIECFINPDRQDLINEIQAAFQRVATAAGKGDQLEYLTSPLKTGQMVNRQLQSKGKKPRPELEGIYVIRASDPNYAPTVVSQDRSMIPAEQAANIFSGCVCNVYVDLYWSNNAQNPGVFCGLRAVQLVDNVNVTRIGSGGPVDPAQVFDVVKDAPPMVNAPPTNPGPAPTLHAVPTPAPAGDPWEA